MMQKIQTNQIEESEESWIFEVRIGSAPDISVHKVIVPKDYWQKLTAEKFSAEELVHKSFEFLLEREPKESILSQFELPQIQNYFPEYEKTISADAKN